MTVNKEINGTSVLISVEGRLDTTTAPQLDEQIKPLDGVTELVIDFAKLQYISSAGLRVLLSAQKVMSKQGSMKLINVSEAVMEIFDVTGFSDILVIE